MQLKFIAAERGEQVVAAASNADEPGLQLFEHRVLLPHIHDPAFAAVLTRLLGERDHTYLLPA